jgi:hypothetical protein
VASLDRRRRLIELVPAAEGFAPEFAGSGVATADRVRREMLEIYRPAVACSAAEIGNASRGAAIPATEGTYPAQSASRIHGDGAVMKRWDSDELNPQSVRP